MNFLTSERLEDRRRGNRKIEELKVKKDKTLVIHYSCESFFNTHGRTPRITCIGIRNRDNGITIAFSIHLMAQIMKKDLASLSDADFDLVEKAMLKEFYDFVKRHSGFRWVHWNMRNASFGFEAIANRFRILGGNPKAIDDQFKYDLPDILGLIHTYNFERHKKPTQGQLLNLAIRNKVTTRDALTGKLEADAFDARDFLLLHMSTMRKLEIIDRILTLQEKNKLKVNVNLFTACGLTIPGIIEVVRNNWILFLAWSLAMAVLGMALEPVVQRWFGTN